MWKSVGLSLLAVTAGQAFAQNILMFSVAPSGPTGLQASTLYHRDNTLPIPAAGGAATGLAVGDVIDGFSKNVSDAQFRICISIDDASVGDKPPVPDLPFPGVAYNATDQASKGQAAGDAFFTTEVFSTDGILPPGPLGPSMGEYNNALQYNQSTPFGPGGLGLAPCIGPDVVTSLVMDDTNGGSGVPTGQSTPPLYITLVTDSSKLGPASGADILYDPTPDLVTGIAGDESLFAVAEELGLAAGDEVDALAVFDNDANGSFSPGDQVLLSLARNSPSLGSASPADILSVRYGKPPTVFCGHKVLGLAASDNVTMIAIQAFVP